MKTILENHNIPFLLPGSTSQLGKARDAYASTLMRNGESRDDIGQMIGHSNSVVIEHYLASIDTERTFKINQSLL